MPHFDWRSEEDEVWQPQKSVKETAVSRSRRFFLWLIPLILLLALGGAWIANYTLNREIEKTEDAIKEDVLIVHRLLDTAATAQDVDLFMAQHDPADSLWYDVQQMLVEQNLYLNRSPLGMFADSEAAESETAVSLAADISEAVVEDLIPYWVEDAAGKLVQARFLRTTIYAQERGQWLRVPLPEDRNYWGSWQIIEAERLTLIFPGRDERLGRRLVEDLDAYVARMCAETAVTCPPGLRFRLRLSYEPTTLLVLAQNYRMLNLSTMSTDPPHTFRMDLPTPTLVGLPVDGIGYEALLRGYARWITAVLAARLDPQQAATDQFVMSQLAKIELAPPPPAIYMLDFPQKEPPPIPFPEQDVLVACKLDNETSLWRYQPQEDTWVDAQAAAGRLQPFQDLSMVWPMPDDSGVLLQLRRQIGDNTRTQLILWSGGKETLLVEEEINLNIVTWMTPRISADGRFLLLYQIIGEAEMPTHVFYLLDLTACAAGQCALQKVEGIPYWQWSPSNEQTLLMDVMSWPENLYLGDGEGNRVRQVGKGWQPFWLNESEFGYVRAVDEHNRFNVGDPQEIVLASIDDEVNEGEVLLDRGDFVAALQAARVPQLSGELQMYLNDVLVSPDSRILYISLFTWSGASGVPVAPEQHYLAYDFSSTNLEYLFASEDSTNFPLTLAQNGRFLVILTAGSNEWMINLYDTGEKRRMQYTLSPSYDYPYPVFDWSEDEQWMVLADDRLLHLIAPAYGYQRTIFHNLTGCRSASWINR